MHAITTLTVMHDRYLLATDTTNFGIELTTAESLHWHQAVSLFNNRLSSLQQYHAQEPTPPSTRVA
jgi:hypothetical protein